MIRFDTFARKQTWNMKKIVLALLVSAFISACGDKNKDYLVKIKTSFGDITVLLYDETPLHKKNFLELAKSGRYDSTLFYRIVDNFMIQGGDIAKKEGVPEKESDRIPAEIQDGLYHVKGALAAARQGDQFNPERKSSSTQFYIVEGNSWDVMTTDLNQLYGRMQQMLQDPANEDLIEEYRPIFARRDNAEIIEWMLSKRSMIEEQFEIDLSIDPKTGDNEAYKAAGGGYPGLDGAYTVFGRVVEGLEVVEKIASVETNRNPATGEKSNPLQPVPLTMEVFDMKKKDITEKYGYVYSE